MLRPGDAACGADICHEGGSGQHTVETYDKKYAKKLIIVKTSYDDVNIPQAVVIPSAPSFNQINSTSEYNSNLTY